MARYPFTLTLTSDGEPGTGLGAEVINDLIPRDHAGRPTLPASHIKGLMRAAWRELAEPLGWGDSLENELFGVREQSRPGLEAGVVLGDAVAELGPQPSVQLVTRTAISQSGVAQSGTLRTVETVPVGTVFHGALHADFAAGSPADLAWRLSLLAIRAVGGGRNRGAGACLTAMKAESRSPGKLLQELDAALTRTQTGVSSSAASSGPASSASAPAASTSPGADDPVVVRLVFRAQTPICCPEIADKTNVITSGFSIPASSVQGAILNRFNRRDESLASALFANSSFRLWPLLPCAGPPGADERPAAELPTPLRVSLTHRAAKFSDPNASETPRFFDEAIDLQPYDWTKVGSGAPLKAADGVLLRYPDGRVSLWKASTMPRMVQAHGVHHDPESPDGRNLYTVAAMAPLTWQGLAVLPRAAADFLLQSLTAEPHVSFGKSRSVRGLGTLSAAIVQGTPAEWQTRTANTVLVAQSPLLLADRPAAGATAEDELRAAAGAWSERHGLPKPEKVWGAVGIRFGWNRHQAGRQPACRVVLPGAVIAFADVLDQDRLASALKSDGVGEDGRQRGFGAVGVHPGKAIEYFEPRSPLRTVGSANSSHDAVKLAVEIYGKNKRLPSTSQLRAVQQRRAREAGEPKETLAYLKHQTERTSRVWFAWAAIVDDVEKLLKTYPKDDACRALEVLIDLSLAGTQNGGRS